MHTGDMVITSTLSDISNSSSPNFVTYNTDLIDDKSVSQIILQLLDKCQIVMTFIGNIANILTAVTLGINGKAISPAILILLRHRAVCDAFICGVMVIRYLRRPGWLPGIYALDIIVCHVWDRRGLFRVSACNLVYLAYKIFLYSFVNSTPSLGSSQT